MIVRPTLITSLRIVPDRSFTWQGRPTRFKTSLTYTVKIHQFKPSKDDRAQQAFLRYTHNETIDSVKAVFPSNFSQIKFFPTELDQKNDRAWDILLRFPPTHRVEIAAQYKVPRRIKALGNMISIRPIFCASLNFRGFRRNSAYCVELIGRSLASMIQSYSSNYLLVHSPENEEWYYEIILACGRNLLTGTKNV